jgi:Undecaprenyl-phosphate glucose phosphotransferase
VSLGAPLDAGSVPAVDAASARTVGAQGLAARARLLDFLVKLVAMEFVTVAMATYLSSVIYYQLVLNRWPDAGYYAFASLSMATAVLLVSIAFRHFSGLQIQPQHRFLWNGLGAVGLAFSFFLSTLFLLKSTADYSRGSFVVQLFAASAAVLLVRAVAHARIQSAVADGLLEARRAVLIGHAGSGQPMVERLRRFGITTVGAFPLPDLHPAEDGPDQTGAQVRQMVDSCRVRRPDDIVLLARPEELSQVAVLTNALSELPAAVHVIPVGLEGVLASAQLGELGKLATVQVLHRPLSLTDQVIKRAFDVVAATAGLIVLAPLMALTALAIKLDSKGPVLFRQTRHGYNNDTIRVFKFRTMTTMEDGDKFRQATRNDARITRVGHVLRRTNIDELPQLINVLRGEMSIVGPRPHPVALNSAFAERLSRFSRRHNVKPGLTGWAQANGFRGETDTFEKMQRRVEADLYYIDNWSLLLDLKIIVMTLFSKRAYVNAG